ncbi:MAG: hypothetical protein B6247_12420 [Candidatus Parabeggiatoa sp. nov. 2]|nr:MAG: hypothetical protein B6247_12420 [Beggiatoa sp. 4572_84]
MSEFKFDDGPLSLLPSITTTFLWLILDKFDDGPLSLLPSITTTFLWLILELSDFKFDDGPLSLLLVPSITNSPRWGLLIVRHFSVLKARGGAPGYINSPRWGLLIVRHFSVFRFHLDIRMRSMKCHTANLL